MAKKLANIVNWSPYLKWDPYKDFQEMQKLFDNDLMLLEDELEALSVNMWKKDGKLVIEASVPGIKSEDLNVTVEGKTLTISGESSTEKEEQDKKRKYFLHEKSFRSIYRTIYLPENIDTEGIIAKDENGLLRIEMPTVESKEVKRITVK